MADCPKLQKKREKFLLFSYTCESYCQLHFFSTSDWHGLNSVLSWGVGTLPDEPPPDSIFDLCVLVWKPKINADDVFHKRSSNLFFQIYFYVYGYFVYICTHVRLVFSEPEKETR